MRNLLIIAAVAAAFVCVGDIQSANAQGYHDGYQFGTGFRFGGVGPFGGGFRSAFQREDAPYFAKFPPVYYSHPVARPYGFSPYALPPGILPAEPMVKPQPKTIVNPHYQAPEETPPPVADPQPEPTPAKKAGFTKPKRIINPFFNALTHAF